MKVQSIISGLKLGLFLVVAGTGGYFGYRFLRADVASQIYEKRLEELALDYRQLADTYNEAVKRTAVTELIVKGETLSVRVRTIEGPTRVIPTPFDPRGEIYVDFVVIDGRLWIRRLFDAGTAPGQGLVIDPALASVGWADADGSQGTQGARGGDGVRVAAAVGKAVYRSLSEGTWVVTVSGDGSLGLSRLEPGTEPRLVARPQIKDYEQVHAEATERASSLTASDIWRELTRGE